MFTRNEIGNPHTVPARISHPWQDLEEYQPDGGMWQIPKSADRHGFVEASADLMSDPDAFADSILLFQKWWMVRGYPDGIPDEAPYALEAKRLAPSWRRVCKSLLRNDYWCKGLGFTQHKSAAYQQYLDLMRRRREQWQIKDDAVAFPPDALF